MREGLKIRVRKILEIMLTIHTLLALPSMARAEVPLTSLEAAFILQFTQYIEIQSEARKPETTIVVLGASDLARILETAIQKKPPGSGIIKLLPEEDMKSAHYIVLGSITPATKEKLVEIVITCHCVTIGLSSFKGEAMIKLVHSEESLKFEVDKGYADKKGIYVSSKLLKLATKVKD
jgi:hypothetical protein